MKGCKTAMSLANATYQYASKLSQEYRHRSTCYTVATVTVNKLFLAFHQAHDIPIWIIPNEIYVPIAGRGVNL
jgi:hypothetical protein